MEPFQVFKKWFALLNEHEVAYLIVGGYAMAFHGAARSAGDIDVFVQADARNAQRVLDAIRAFSFGSPGLTVEDFQKPDHVIQPGVPPIRIDILTSVSGVAWQEAWTSRVPGAYAEVPVHFIGRDQLIANKKPIGRKRDAADPKVIGE